MPVAAQLKMGIELEVIWLDQDVVEYKFACSNGRFSGTAEIYLSHNELDTVAEQLSGFPLHQDDIRQFELGTFNPKHADGGIRLYFFCLDAKGHCAVDVRLRGDACEGMGEPESVALRIPLEPAAIDDFVAELRGLGVEDGASAHLAMAV